MSSSSSANAGSGSLPVQLAQPQKMAVDELSAPETAPIVRILKYCEALPAAIMESIIVDQFMVSMVEKTRPRKRSSTCFSRLDQLRTELTATLARETPMKKSAQRQFVIWLKTMYAPPWNR